jgi:Flp pilus assembly pilin Flp
MWVRCVRALWREETGQDLIEWSLLLAFVALVSVGVISSFQPNFLRLFDSISNGVTDAITALH